MKVDELPVIDENGSLILDKKLLKAENRPLLKSIEGSGRTIKKVKIYLCELTEVHRRSIVYVLSKFSATITHIGLYRCGTKGLEKAYLFEILSLVPNTEHLVIGFNGVSDDQPETSNNGDLNLKHLKILELNRCDEMFEFFFNGLPVGVIRQFSWCGRNLLSLETLFSRQTNIKKLSLVQWHSYEFSDNSRVQLPANILDSLELEILEMENIDIETAALSRQIKLKSLSTDKNDVVMKVVVNNLTELEQLKWKVTDTTPLDDFVNISRLKNLKRLTLQGVGAGIITELIQLDDSRIRTLEIEDFDDESVHQFQVLAKAAPNLKVVTWANGKAFQLK